MPVGLLRSWPRIVQTERLPVERDVTMNHWHGLESTSYRSV
jgi:hypothetical protein